MKIQLKIYTLFISFFILLNPGDSFSDSVTGSAKPNEKVKITADNLVSDRNAAYALFSGNVKAVRGEAVLTADKMKIFFTEKKKKNDENNEKIMDEKTTEANSGKSSIDTILATGNVHFLFENKTATAGVAEYITKKEVITLTKDNPTIKSADNVITGTKIIINRKDNQVHVFGDKTRKVEAEFFPETISK